MRPRPHGETLVVPEQRAQFGVELVGAVSAVNPAGSVSAVGPAGSVVSVGTVVPGGVGSVGTHRAHLPSLPVSRCSLPRREPSALLAWLFTVPGLMPSESAISASLSPS